MFYSITGTVVFMGENSIGIDCNGVAFFINTTANTLRSCAREGEIQTLYTYLSVREDALDLAIAVAGEDPKSITVAQGVGAKIANRIILELKGKLDTFAVTAKSAGDLAAVKKSTISYAGEDAVNALVQLGYGKSEASIAVGRLDGDLSTEQMIKKALVYLAKQL